MLNKHHKLAIFMEGALGTRHGKMGYGLLRYSPNDIVCVIDSHHAGAQVRDVIDSPRNCQVVGDIRSARRLGADVLVLGIAPSGGRLPPEWLTQITAAVESGMSVVNGLHEPLAPQFQHLQQHQWIWDIRKEPDDLPIASGRARKLQCIRLLTVGTDMATGKMTAGLEVYRELKRRQIKADFLATGQIGISITGRGLPLDAVRLDYAAGGVEKMVLDARDRDILIIEGQGAINHPGSSATLPLLRGACPTHLLLCHRAGQKVLHRVPDIPIPPLSKCISLYQDLAETAGLFPRPDILGVSLNTSALPEDEARSAVKRLQAEMNLPVTDPLRYGVENIVEKLIKSL